MATSATLGKGGGGTDGGSAIREVAEQILGIAFDEESLVGEDRYEPGEFVASQDFNLPLPDPEALAAIDDRDPDLMAKVAELLLGAANLGHAGLDDPRRLGMLLRRHPLTKAVLDSLGLDPRTFDEVIEVLPRKNATGWGSAMKTRPEITAKDLAASSACCRWRRTRTRRRTVRARC